MVASNRTVTWEGIPALLPASWVYRGVSTLTRSLRTPGAPEQAAPRVISVGNLEVGGNGKTPLALWLLARLAQSGRRAAYVSRGFGSTAERGPLVTVVPSGGESVLGSFAGLRIVSRDAKNLAVAVGDEATLVARRSPHIPLAIARDKRRAVATASRLGAEVVVVDDAFQSFALPRHVDVLMLDARRPIANGRVLPAGRLREAPSAIGRAHVVVFNGAGDGSSIDRARASVARWLSPHARIYGLRRDITLVPARNAREAAPSEAILVSGIARPDSLRAAVEGTGVRVCETIVFRDHHRYADADVREVQARASGRAVVTTEKDWVKLERFDWTDGAVFLARLDVSIVGEDDVASWLLGAG